MSISFLETVPCESLVSLRRRNALENVQEVITQRASGIILNELSATDYQWYQKMEAERMQELSNKVSDLVTSEVAPAILAYLSKRFPDRMNHPDTEWAPNLCDNLSIDIVHTPTTKSMISDDIQISSHDRLAGFYFNNINKSRKIRLLLDDILQDFVDSPLEEEVFFDFLFQITLHEMLHSASVVSYMTDEEECAERRAVALRESIIGQHPVDWQEMAYRVGYAYNFVNSLSGVQEREIAYQTLQKVIPFNEGLTDILATKIYRECSQLKYKAPRPRYTVSYKREAYEVYRTIREYAGITGIPAVTIFRDIEEWYFFYDPDETAFTKYVQPMMEYYEG